MVESWTIIGYLIKSILNSFDNEKIRCYFTGNLIIDEKISAHILVFDIIIKTIDHLLSIFIKIESRVRKLITLAIGCIFFSLVKACSILDRNLQEFLRYANDFSKELFLDFLSRIYKAKNVIYLHKSFLRNQLTDPLALRLSWIQRQK